MLMESRRRRHGWQLPLHPLQIVGISLFAVLVAAFYAFLWRFVGNRVVENVLITLFTFAASSVALLFVRCVAIDPSDRTGIRRRKGAKKVKESAKLNLKAMVRLILLRFSRRLEKKALKFFIRRNYMEPGDGSPPMEPLLPFPLVEKDDAVTPDPRDNEISFCSICDSEVKLHSKHCKNCNRCVEGFDHHCRWLNNCVGRKNYTSFVLLVVLVLLMLLVEGGSSVAVFVRCFADKQGITEDLHHNLPLHFPKGLLAAIAALLFLATAYATAALGQLLFFHVVLIRKGMRTYDYILAMRHQDPFDDLYSSDDDEDYDDDDSVDFSHMSDKPSLVSRSFCRGRCTKSQESTMKAIRVDPVKTPEFSIDPWNLIRMSREKAMAAAAKARERMKRENAPPSPPKPLPTEMKKGPSVHRFLSPRRRFSSGSSASPKQKQMYRRSFDLKLSEMSGELETYISRQVVCSVLRSEEDDSASSPVGPR